MLVAALFLTFFFAAVCADNLSAGSSRFLGTDRKPETEFSLVTFASTVGAIVDTIWQGENRTYDHAIPVPKIYGVNVSFFSWLFSFRRVSLRVGSRLLSQIASADAVDYIVDYRSVAGSSQNRGCFLPSGWQWVDNCVRPARSAGNLNGLLPHTSVANRRTQFSSSIGRPGLLKQT